MELNDKYRRLEEKLNNKKYDLIQLNENLNKLNELCRKIKNRTILETRIEEVMRLEDILIEKETDRAKIESSIFFLEKEVETLERELHSLKVIVNNVNVRVVSVNKTKRRLFISIPLYACENTLLLPSLLTFFLHKTLSRTQVILSTFPLVKEEVKRKVLEEFRRLN
jgi:nitrate/nitrite-specific signal transduction histidine kinase